MDNARFRRDFRKLLMMSGARAELVVRKTALELVSELIRRSPVGNPSLWQANAEVVTARTAYVEGAMDYNAANPGKRRIGTSNAALNKIFTLNAGIGYVGGRFRSNWMVSYDSIDYSADREPKEDAMAKAEIMLKAYQAGASIYISNSLPYSRKLEHGHSKQAPNGMIGLTVISYGKSLREVISEVYK